MAGASPATTISQLCTTLTFHVKRVFNAYIVVATLAVAMFHGHCDRCRSPLQALLENGY